MTRREQNIWARLHQIRELVRSGITEMTGKTYRGADGKIAGRFKGGFTKQFPEIDRAGLTPGQAAAAVERGKGPRFVRLVREIAKDFPDRKKRGPGKPQVEPHAGSKACEACGVEHSKDKHRFHGEGSFYRTHISAGERAAMRQNPSRKKARALVTIYGRVLSIAAQKTQKHVCDAECKEYVHKYQHDFRKNSAAMYGLPEGSTLVLPDGTQIRLHDRTLLISTRL